MNKLAVVPSSGALVKCPAMDCTEQFCYATPLHFHMLQHKTGTMFQCCDSHKPTSDRIRFYVIFCSLHSQEETSTFRDFLLPEEARRPNDELDEATIQDETLRPAYTTLTSSLGPTLENTISCNDSHWSDNLFLECTPPRQRKRASSTYEHENMCPLGLSSKKQRYVPVAAGARQRDRD